MIQANELRIGNFIEWEDDSHEVVIVTSIERRRGLSHILMFDGYNGSESGGALVDEFIGVKLTEEWLLKFGFVNNGQNVYDLEGWYPYLQEHDGLYKVRRVPTLPIRYVHELQNLYFALSGEELTLSNKKEGK